MKRLLAVVALGMAAVTACTSSTSASSLKAGGKEDTDTHMIQATVEDVQVALGEVVKKPTQANVDQLAQTAQTAHDNLNNAKTEWAVDAPLDDKSTSVAVAINDLKNSMGALVAYTGDPNSATLAKFTAQWQQGVGEWNDAVTTLYAKAARSAPTIPTV